MILLLGVSGPARYELARFLQEVHLEDPLESSTRCLLHFSDKTSGDLLGTPESAYVISKISGFLG